MSHASKGPATAPMAFWWKVTCSASVEVAHDEGAADDVGVPAAVLRGGVDDDVGAEGQRLLEVRRGEGVVDDEQRAGLVGDRGERLDVADVEQRVGGRLDPHQPGRTRPDRGPHRVEVGHRRRAVLEAPALLDLVEQPEGAAVRVVGDDHVVARGGTGPGSACPRRPGRTRRRTRARPPRAPPGCPRGRCGSGWRSGCTRSRRATRRRRPACRSTSRRSAGSPHPSWGPARSPRGSRGSRSRTCVGAPVQSRTDSTVSDSRRGQGRSGDGVGRLG